IRRDTRCRLQARESRPWSTLNTETTELTEIAGPRKDGEYSWLIYFSCFRVFVADLCGLRGLCVDCVHFSRDAVTRFRSPATTRTDEDHFRYPSCSRRTTCAPAPICGSSTGATPISLPSTNTFAPGGSESTLSDPKNDGAGVLAAGTGVRAAGSGRARVSATEMDWARRDPEKTTRRSSVV